MSYFLDPVEMPRVSFDSPVVGLVLRLERLRHVFAVATTPRPWLAQLDQGLAASLDDFACLEGLPEFSLGEDFIRAVRGTLPGDYGREYRHMDYIPGLMWDLERFLKCDFGPQYDFLKIAVVFRRFLEISPFVTENEAVARRFAVALVRRCIPGAIFDSSKVFAADGSVAGDMGVFCERVLQNLAEALESTVKLLDLAHVRQEILEPSVRALERRRLVNRDEMRAILVAAEKPEFGAQDLAHIWADPFLRSRCIRKMIDAQFFTPLKEGGRRYMLNLGRIVDLGR